MLSSMRVKGVDPAEADPAIQRVFASQTRKWGAPLNNHLIYARRAPIFQGVRAMWAGIDASGLIDGKLQCLINRRIAGLNGCEF